MPDAVDQALTKRLILARGAAVLLFLGLIARLWYLQGIQGEYFRDQSENNRLRTIRTVAPRGNIIDQHGTLLVRNRTSFDIGLILEDIENLEVTLRLLSEVTGRDIELMKKQLALPRKKMPFEPKTVIVDAPREEVAKIKANGYRLPGVIVSTVPARDYPYGGLGSQFAGYVREISKSQLDSFGADSGYRFGDMVGQAGLEKKYEKYLRGLSGVSKVEVDARGNRKGEITAVDVGEGADLVLGIDIDMQRAAEEGLAGRRGAVIAIDPNNGEILTLASSPSVDGALFSGKVDAKTWAAVTKDPNKPLANRAISARYPPGSTWKLFMAAAGLTHKKINSRTTFNCPGYFSLGGRPYKCHKHSGHGIVDLAKAITVSCNVYFYQLGQLLQLEGIEKFSRSFGFGTQTGIDLPGEEAGIVPSEKWKREVMKEKWYPGDTVPVSIGQGLMGVTPLQMAVAVAAIANGGTIYKPRLVRAIVPKDGTPPLVTEPEVRSRVDIDPASLDAIRQFSIGVVNDPRGTGKRAQLPGIVVAGKTGTAQVGVLGKEKLDDKFKDHAWFVSFAPADKPIIATAVIIENSGHGGEFAAPVSRQVMEAFFRKRGMLEQPTVAVDHSPIIGEEDDSAEPEIYPGEESIREED